MTPCPSQTSRRTRPAGSSGNQGSLPRIPVASAPSHRDGLRHQPFKILLARVAALCPVRCGRGMLRGRLNLRRGRNSSWRQRARWGSAVLQCIHGQHPGDDCFGHPSAPRCIEAPAANRAAEHLALAAVAARRESIPAPKANAVFRHLENQEAADDDGRGCIVSLALAPASLTASHNRYVGLLIP
jgi:hypothetical protein